jgi:Xaa-Pro dipeptidase
VAEIARAGFEANYRKRTGYSVGVSYPPDWGEGHILSLRHGDPTPLEPGMVFHVVPALREYGRWAVGVSETVLVTPDGCEVLTNFPRRLFEAGRRAM